MIVEDPLRPGNQVLSFTALNSGGDIFGSEISVTEVDPEIRTGG